MTFKDLVDKCVLPNVTECLGQNATFKPKFGASYTVRVVFDKRFEMVDADTETLISSNAPNVLVRLSEFSPLPKKGDMIELENINYQVIDVLEDGQGGANLPLHKCE